MCRLLGKIAHYVVITSVVIIGVIVSQPVAAQVTTGSISGTVTDATGAIIPGANVTIRNVGTDLRRTIVTSAAGLYMAADLEVGQYEITVQQKGFATVKKVGIDLTVGAALMENVSLTVGATTEVVEVEAAAAQVETASSQVGVLVGEKQMVDLPLNGRDYNQLIILAPGMQPVTNNLQSSLMGRATTFMVGGARPEGQAILLDGTDVQGYYMQGSGLTMLGTSLGVDGIAEFETLTNTYSAEFGGTGTAINMVTKAGTNQLHGSAYDFLRNSVFDAKNYFDSATRPIPEFRRNQFGGSVGGPIKKDSRFFFVNYEGYRQALRQTVVGYVPDLNAHNGQLPCNAAPGLTCNTTTGLVTIPLASVTQQLLALYPTTGLGAETGSGTAGYTNVGSNPVNENYLIGRVDWKLSPKDDFLVRVVRDAGTFGVPFPSGVVSGDPELDTTANYYTTLQERRTFTTNLINVLRFSFVRTQNYGNSAGTLGGILNEFSDRNADEDIAITGVTTIGTAAQVPMTEVQNKFPVDDQVYWTHGAHDLRIGGTINREQTREWTSIGYNGQWTFQSLQAMLQNNAYSFAAAPVGKYDGRRVFHQIDFAAYFEDNWKMSRRLTLNMGLRYEPTTNPKGDSGTPMETIINPLTDTGWTVVHHAFLANSTLTDYDPRIGLAYSPFGNAKTVVHAGFGEFHDPIEPAFYSGWFNTGPPLSTTLTQYSVTFPIPFSGTGAPAKPNTISGSGYKFPQGAHGTYIMEWNLRVERQLGSGLIASAGYIGSRGNHLLNTVNFNPATYTLNGSGQKVFTGTLVNPAFNYINGSQPVSMSNYNSLQLTLAGQVARSLQMQLNYTYSRTMSDADNSTNSELSAGPNSQGDPYNIWYDYGLSSYNITQVFTGHLLYDLPLHKNAWVSGWEWGLLSQVHTGMPFNPGIGYDFCKLTTACGRPDRVGNPYQAGTIAANPTCVAPAAIHTAAHWYNPCAFMLPGATAANLHGVPGTLGDIHRNDQIGPAYMGMDTSLQKSTHIAERVNLQLRFEAFNFINRANFAEPGTTLFGSTSGGLPLGTAGTITATSSAAASRQLQFSAKLIF